MGTSLGVLYLGSSFGASTPSPLKSSVLEHTCEGLNARMLGRFTGNRQGKAERPTMPAWTPKVCRIIAFSRFWATILYLLLGDPGGYARAGGKAQNAEEQIMLLDGSRPGLHNIGL